jgi:hypothetical protein
MSSYISEEAYSSTDIASEKLSNTNSLMNENNYN